MFGEHRMRRARDGRCGGPFGEGPERMRAMRRGAGGRGPFGMGRGWGGRHRLFEQGDLKLLVLALLAEQPRHGYELIKEIEARVGGGYAPSPGVIYPQLTMLEEMGLIRLASEEGGKKRYAVTALGEAEIAEQKTRIDALFALMAQARETNSAGRAPQIMRAMENLKLALRLKFEGGELDEEGVNAVAAAIDAAAVAIEKIEKKK